MRFTIVFLLVFFMVKPVLSQQPSKKEIQDRIKQAQEKAQQIIESAKKNNRNGNPKACPEARWTGTLRLVEKFKGITGTSERLVDISFTNALPTLYRNDTTTNLAFPDDKGTGSVKFHGEEIIEGKFFGTTDCSGSDETELHEVVIDESDTTYRIHAIGPGCIGKSVSALDGSTTPYGPEATDIIVSEQRLGVNHSFLSGSETTVKDIGVGEVSRTIIWNLKKPCPPWKDSYTEKRKNALDARIKDKVSKFIKRVNDDLCIQLRVAQGLRTKAEQDNLYELGRTKPGKIVTNARGGHSNHNSGLAIDVYVVNCDGTIDLDKRVPKEVVDIAKENGFEWGGDWKKFKDYPHFEMNF